MHVPDLNRRLSAVRTVVRTSLDANGPQRRRLSADRVPAAVSDDRTVLPELDLSIPPWPGEVHEVDGNDLFVRHTPTTAPGRVPAAVYVHGLGGASTNWTDVAGQLAPFVDGFALDLPGFGRSGPSATGEYTIRAHARVVTAYLEQVVAASGGPVHLFGNSMGGAIAIRVAARRPELIRTLTLISPAVPDLRVRRDDDPRTPLMLVPGIAKVAMRKLDAAGPRARAKGVINLCFGNPSRVPAHRIQEAADEITARAGMTWAGPAFVASMKGLVGTWFTARPWRDMARIAAPTLVLWGDHDRLVSPALAPKVTATIPRAWLSVRPGIGHVAQLEEPVQTARFWLGTVYRRGGVPAGARVGADTPTAADGTPTSTAGLTSQKS